MECRTSGCGGRCIGCNVLPLEGSVQLPLDVTEVFCDHALCSSRIIGKGLLVDLPAGYKDIRCDKA